MLNTPIRLTPVTLAIGGFIVALLLTTALLHSGVHAFPLETRTTVHPKAYQLPRIPGGITLRMAMLHDVLLDRYLPHGIAWNEQRVRASRAVMERRAASSRPAADFALLDAMDDLAVALENLHRSSEAAQVMRDKLRLLPPLTVDVPVPPNVESRLRPYDEQLVELSDERHAASLAPEAYHQYTARANLGTFLIHAAFSGALSHDRAALTPLAEGRQFIQQSIALNPAAHFGREKWQAIVVGHFLAAVDHPELLTDFDIIGNALDDFGALDRTALRRVHYLDSLDAPAVWLDRRLSSEDRVMRRSRLRTTGIDLDWARLVHPSVTNPVPFDDPALALLGMWTLGGGPNPHAALALAHIAEQIGQYEIAFEAYQRALDLRVRFSPEASIRDVLVRHCQERQSAIAVLEAPENSAAWESRTRQRHHDELAWAHGYVAEYHAFEAGQIEKGVALDAPDFYDAFFRSHPAIASSVGRSDEVNAVLLDPHGFLDAVPVALLVGGVFSVVGVLGRGRGRG